MYSRVGLIAAGFLFLSLPVGCVSWPTRAELEAANCGVKPTQEYAEAIGEALVRDRLKDPESARFSWAPLARGSFRKPLGKIRFAWQLRGSVNAKNSYGGYAGAEPRYFYFRGNRVVGRCELLTFDNNRLDLDPVIVCAEAESVDWDEGEQLTPPQNRREPSPETVIEKPRAVESPWLRLRRGLDEIAVRDLLGEPAEKSVSTTSTIWFYPDINDGYVLFKSDRVHSWKAP